MKPFFTFGLLFLMALTLCRAQGTFLFSQCLKPLPDQVEIISQKIIPDHSIRVAAEQMKCYLPLLQEKKVAVVANQSSLIGKTHLVDTLLSEKVAVKAIFSPEHGFRGDAEAGAQVANGIDARTGVPIFSLYGNSKKPSSENLKDIDIVVFDLQDVGCRFYTYISTLHYVMEACAENHIPLLVLDRPNPNGHYVDGPVMEKKYCSFVGMHAGVPVVYGMTIGEYALMINEEGWLPNNLHCQLSVAPLLHYTHDSIYHLPVNPSPNLRTPQAIALYPSLCLFEGTTISVGRGTPYPFEVIGNEYKMDLREVEVPAQFDLHYLLEMYAHTAKDKFFQKSNFFEKLAGTASLRQQIINEVPESEIRQSWKEGLAHFKQIRSQYLLYP